MVIKSILDVITNSSSEVFVVKSDKTPQEYLDYLLKNKNTEDIGSGIGGELSVYNCEEVVGNNDDSYLEYAHLPKNYLYIDTDWGFKHLINLIKSDSGYIGNIDNEKDIDLHVFENIHALFWYLERLHSLNQIKDPEIKDLIISKLEDAEKLIQDYLK